MSGEEPEEKDHVPPFLRGQPYVPEPLGKDDIDEQPDTNMNEQDDVVIIPVDGTPTLRTIVTFDNHFGEEEGDQNCVQPIEGAPPNAIGPPRIWRNRTQIFAEVI